MNREWLTTSLGKVVTLQRGFDLPTKDRKPGSNPVVSSAGISGTHSEARVRCPGVVTGRYGTIGSVFYVDRDFWPLNTTLYVRDFQGNDPKFVYYLLKSLDFSAYSDKSSVPGVNRNHLHSMEVRIPSDLEHQRAIANVLGILDDKIELNRRMNETLEELAATIFRAWFVEFEPVRAKMAGRAPVGMDAATAALFPDRLVASELGEIPEGWECLYLSDLCSTQYGYTASATTESVGPRFLRVMDINKSSWITWDTVPYCVASDRERGKFGLSPGDIVVARMADPGKSAIIDEDVDAVFASYLVRLKTPSLAHSHYIFRYLKSDFYQSYVDGAKGGSVQANMNAKVIVRSQLVLPSESLLKKFLDVVLPMREKIAANNRQSSTLAELRDTLLPRLLSGELRVPEEMLTP